MKTAKIYSISDPETKEVRYIGKTEMTLEKRLYYHFREIKNTKNKHKQRWFNKLLKNGKKPVIELVDIVPLSEWKFWEKHYISLFKSWGFNLINYTEGGEGFNSEWVRRLWRKKEYREYHTKRVQGKKNPFYGKKHSEETKKILREKCPKRGKEHGCYGKKHSKEDIEKMRLNQPTIKVIIRMDMNWCEIDEWVGLKYMCRELFLDEAAVLRVIKGKNNHHKKFKFKYKKS